MKTTKEIVIEALTEPQEVCGDGSCLICQIGNYLGRGRHARRDYSIEIQEAIATILMNIVTENGEGAVLKTTADEQLRVLVIDVFKAGLLFGVHIGDMIRMEQMTGEPE